MGDKRYKSAHFMRKQMKEDLKDEVRKLRDELAQLKPVPNPEQVAAENDVISTTIRQQQLGIASLESAMPPLLQTHPLYSRISLNKCWDTRRATLLALREKKLKAAYEYVTVRSQMAQPQLSDHRFETANGDTCCVIFQTMHLFGVRSLQQVYDALLFSIDNAEISISEQLGHVTVRDDYEGVDGNILNARIVSTNHDGVATELNCIMMSQVLDGTEGASWGDPCGIVVIDSVDQDELYPYMSSQRIRKDVSCTFVLTVRQAPSSADEMVVTLRRAAFVKLHRPEFEISEAVWQESQQEAARWGDVVIQSIRSVLYSMP